MDSIVEVLQWLFMLGTLLTVVVNTASIKRLTWRIERLERQRELM